MNATYTETPADLVFSPQTPFSWTRRWARAHRNPRQQTPRSPQPPRPVTHAEQRSGSSDTTAYRDVTATHA
jgi:hypothetical protein